MSVNSPILPVAERETVRARVRALARSHTKGLVWALLLYSVAVAAGLVGPRLLGDMVQNIERGTTTEYLNLVILAIAGFIVVQALLTRWAFRAAGRVAAWMLSSLRVEFVDRILALPLSKVEESTDGDLVTRASRDTDTMRNSMQMAVPQTCVSIVTVVLTVGAMLLVSPLLTTVLLVIVPPLIIVNRWYLRHSRAAYLREAAAYADITGGLAATVQGAATVEALGLQDHRVEQTRKDVHKANAEVRYTLRLRTVLYLVDEFLFGLPLVGALLLGGVAYSQGWVDIAQVTAITLYILMLMGPLEVLLDWLPTLQSAGVSLARLQGVAEVPQDREPSRRAADGPGELLVHDARFAYVKERDVLHGLDLEVRPGERLAIVGPSGSGKSTLARLLAGINGPRAGHVTSDGVPLLELPLEDLRGEVALVTQNHHVFVATLRENLCLAAGEDLDDAELWRALEAVGAHTWAQDMPRGLDTRLGIEEPDLSAPQAQQLALARMLLADPKVMILDEATSSLDPKAARHLERSFSAVLEGRTVIAITHMLPSASTADRIAVIEHGRVTEIGSHEELINSGGTYAALWRSWQ